MIFSVHSDAGLHNKNKVRSREVAHIFLSENDPMPRWNGPVINIAQIIIFVVSSDSEEELRAIFITSQDMVAMRNNMEEMRWPQPKSPIQTDRSAVAVVVNNNIVLRKLKTMDRRLHWIRYREAQGQF